MSETIVQTRLGIIAGIFDFWRDFNTRDRAKEGLETEPDTHLVCCPPEWPSHGVLERWSGAMREAADENAKLTAALQQISDMGPMSVDDQRWRIASIALGNKEDQQDEHPRPAP